jgi:hypothetical protein
MGCIPCSPYINVWWFLRLTKHEERVYTDMTPEYLQVLEPEISYITAEFTEH